MRSVVIPDVLAMTANKSPQQPCASERAPSADDCTVFVLCGGQGSRLRSAVADRPKVLAEVAGRPFLFHLLDRIADRGFERVVLCTGYLGDQVEAAIAGGYRSLEIECSFEESPLGTAGAIKQALLQAPSASIVVLNGDSGCDVDIAEFWHWCVAENVVAALVAVKVPDGAAYGTLELGPSDQVLGFCEKRGVSEAAVINAGIYFFRRGVIDDLPEGPLSLEHDVLPDLCRRHLKYWQTDGRFIDIGTPASYAQADAFFAPQRVGLLILDRDGTLIKEKHYLSDPDQVELLPGVIDGLRALKRLGYDLAVVTNQSGIGRGYFAESDLEEVNAKMLDLLEAAGVQIESVYHCPHHPDHGCGCRKPEPGMIEAAAKALGYQPSDCLVVGDKDCDIDLGTRVGARTALVRTGYGQETERIGQCRPDLVVDGLRELAQLEAYR